VCTRLLTSCALQYKYVEQEKAVLIAHAVATSTLRSTERALARFFAAALNVSAERCVVCVRQRCVRSSVIRPRSSTPSRVSVMPMYVPRRVVLRA
jgi:hypothetical protein